MPRLLRDKEQQKGQYKEQNMGPTKYAQARKRNSIFVK